MNAIIGMAELLLESKLNREQKEYVRIFKSAGENLLGLINDILDLSKVEAGHFELEEVDFDLRGLNDIYANIHEVNKSIIERLRNSVGSDSSINALLILDMFAYAVPDVVNESLDEIKEVFTAYPLASGKANGPAG